MDKNVLCRVLNFSPGNNLCLSRSHLFRQLRDLFRRILPKKAGGRHKTLLLPIIWQTSLNRLSTITRAPEPPTFIEIVCLFPLTQRVHIATVKCGLLFASQAQPCLMFCQSVLIGWNRDSDPPFCSSQLIFLRFTFHRVPVLCLRSILWRDWVKLCYVSHVYVYPCLDIRLLSFSTSLL